MFTLIVDKRSSFSAALARTIYTGSTGDRRDGFPRVALLERVALGPRCDCVSAQTKHLRGRRPSAMGCLFPLTTHTCSWKT